MKTKYLLVISLLLPFFALAIVTDNDDQQVVKIENFYPIRYVEDNSTSVTPETPNILVLNKTNKCDSDYVEISPRSLNIDKDSFDQLWSALIKGISPEKQYIFTYGKCHIDGPLVIKIEECTAEKCGVDALVDESLIWLTTWSWRGIIELPRPKLDEYTLAQKASAHFFIKNPLEYDSEKKAWHFQLKYVHKPDVTAMEGYMNNSDFYKGLFVNQARAYRPDNSLYFESYYNNNGELDGTVTYYHPNNQIEMQLQYQNGLLRGEAISYDENGILIKK